MATTQQKQVRQRDSQRLARAQLTLVEHALCPLATTVSLQPNLIHETSYFFTDRHRNRRQARVRIGALHGMSPHDEIYLWGLLSLALSQPEPATDLMATPYYCLRQLGLISSDKKGGREFELFRAALKRLAGIRYENDYFYDPIRGEHRMVSVGLLNYSLPLDENSSRAWRFAWDPIFFELAQASGGALSFDLGLYRKFDPATRRLYLFLKKVFFRQDVSPKLDLRHLAVDVLGFSPELETKHLKQKLLRCVEKLLAAELLRLPQATSSPRNLFEKRSPGAYVVRLYRGTRFHAAALPTKMPVDATPLSDPLKAIGFDAPAIRHICTHYAPKVIQEWADITLAALERNGKEFFTRSPQAYFMDNLKAAAAGNRTPPDWWRELRKQERQLEEEQQAAKTGVFPADSDDAFGRYLETEAREAFQEIMQRLVPDFRAAGQAEPEARERAMHFARMHLRNQFQRRDQHRA